MHLSSKFVERTPWNVCSICRAEAQEFTGTSVESNLAQSCEIRILGTYITISVDQTQLFYGSSLTGALYSGCHDRGSLVFDLLWCSADPWQRAGVWQAGSNDTNGESLTNGNFSWWFNLVGGLVAMNFIFPEILGFDHHPNWLSLVYFSGRGGLSNQQAVTILLAYHAQMLHGAGIFTYITGQFLGFLCR